MSALLESFSAQFESLRQAIRDAHNLGDARRDALAITLADGLPGPRTESWKYTSLRALSARSFASTQEHGPEIDQTVLDGIPSPRIVFVNGHYASRHSSLDDLDDQVELEPLCMALAGDDSRSVAVLGRRFSGKDETFARLNAALAIDGALLRIPAHAVLTKPLHLVFIGVADRTDVASHVRNLIELREGSRATIVEHHLGSGAHRNLQNLISHVHLARGATLVHARVQAEDMGATLIARTDAVLASGAEYRRADLELGAGLSRHELNIALQGEGATAIAGGVLLADGRRHLDTRLGIEHQARDTRCELPWRGLADERGRAVFHGGILIQAGADGSDANLSNKNLLLSENAEIDTQPVLVIHADEVKAAHGATVGRLDETALFYLRSRGLGREQARQLLIQAFLREPLAVLDDAALAESLGARITQRLDRKDASA